MVLDFIAWRDATLFGYTDAKCIGIDLHHAGIVFTSCRRFVAMMRKCH